MTVARYVHNANVSVRRGFHAGYKSRNEKLSEIEVSDDVRSELSVVAVSRDLVNRAPHHSSRVKEDVKPNLGSANNPKESRRVKRTSQ